MKAGIVVIMLLAVLLLGGCEEPLRLAPSQAQKQTAFLTADIAKAVEQNGTDPASPASKKLVQGTRAMAIYMGTPKVPADPDEFETVVSQAEQQAYERPDPWKIADNLLELGIGVAAIVGGGTGTIVVNRLRKLRQKSKALKEVVMGNELLKENGGDFKKAHRAQSPKTKTIIAEIRASNAIPPIPTKT